MTDVYRDSPIVDKIVEDIKALTEEQRFKLFKKFAIGTSFCMRCHEAISCDTYHWRDCRCKGKI